MVLEKQKLNVLRMKSFIFLAVILPVICTSQSLKFVGVDESSKQWRAETFPVNLKLNSSTKMDASLQVVDTTLILQLKGFGVGTSSIDKDGQLVLTLDNGINVTAKATSIQAIEYGQALPSYQHYYFLSSRDLETLAKHDLRSIRKYSIGGYDDIAVDAKNRTKLKDASNLLFAEIKKQNRMPAKNTLFAPAFPGGKQVLINFLNRNLTPVQGLLPNAVSAATIQFRVTSTGNIQDIQVRNAGNALLEGELIRVLNRMPKWKPAYENEKAVDKTITHNLRISRAENGVMVSLD